MADAARDPSFSTPLPRPRGDADPASRPRHPPHSLSFTAGSDAAAATPGSARTSRRRGGSASNIFTGASAAAPRVLAELPGRIAKGVAHLHPAELRDDAQELLRRTREGVATGITKLKGTAAYQTVGKTVGKPLNAVRDATEARLTAIEARLEARLRARFGGYDTSQSSAVRARQKLEAYQKLFKLLDAGGRCVDPRCCRPAAAR